MPSILKLEPSEPGGEENRRGILFQDHVAAGFYLEMLQGDDILIVWCEADDDITLVRKRNDTIVGEFVQVKGRDLEQLWSIALLCRNDPNSSMIEKSLSRDKYEEGAYFRIVTTLGVNKDIALLTYSYDHPHRIASTTEMDGIAQTLPLAIKQLRSPMGNDYSYWLQRMTWDVRHSIDAEQNKNLVNLADALQALQIYQAPDQRKVLYRALVRKAFDAGASSRLRNPDDKKLTKEDLLLLVRKATDNNPIAQKGTAAKFTDAGIPSAAIGHAQDLRLRYSKLKKAATDLRREQLSELESEVGAWLHLQWAELEAGNVNDSEAEFYTRCLQGLHEIVERRATSEITDDIVQGIMYERVKRGLHRFNRSTL